MKEFVEKLIERLEEYRNFEDHDGLDRQCIDGTIQIVKDLTEEYKECALCYLGSPCEYQNKDAILPPELLADNNGWISVEDELPPRNESVLCWAVSLARGGDCCCLGSCDNGFWFMQTQIDTYGFPQQYEVVAWHKLPAPYKKGE